MLLAYLISGLAFGMMVAIIVFIDGGPWWACTLSYSISGAVGYGIGVLRLYIPNDWFSAFLRQLTHSRA